MGRLQLVDTTSCTRCSCCITMGSRTLKSPLHTPHLECVTYVGWGVVKGLVGTGGVGGWGGVHTWAKRGEVLCLFGLHGKERV